MPVRHASGLVRIGIFAGLLATFAALSAMGRAGELELVQFDIAWAKPNPHPLRAHLRRPSGMGPFPAVVLLHGCDGDWQAIDDGWGKLLASWGYVALAVDSYGPRGIRAACNNELIPPDLFDAYSALVFLRGLPFVASGRVALMGVSTGGTRTLWSVEHGFVERQFPEKFRAAIALYPQCSAVTGRMTVPTLILIGEHDDWTRASDCRDLLMRTGSGPSPADDARSVLRLVIYPGAYHAFDNPAFRTGRRVLGRRLKYDETMAQRAAADVRTFLRDAFGG